MITDVTIENHRHETLTINLRNPDSSGFFINKIDGLGLPKANINIDTLITDGGRFNSSRLDTRNILIELGFMNMDNLSIEEIRTLAYLYFPVKQKVIFTVKTDEKEIAIDGYVESNEVNMFAERSTTSISILCPDPYFHGLETLSFFPSNNVAGFQFPYENVGLLPATIFGYVQDFPNQSSIVNYTGTVETGLVIVLNISPGTGDIKIIDSTKDMFIDLDISAIEDVIGSSIKYTDQVIISTVVGSRYAVVISDSTIYNILNVILSTNPNMDWLYMNPGNNSIYFTGASSEQVYMIGYFVPLYGGV